MRRLWQLLRSLRVDFTKKDWELIRKHLTPQEQVIFYRLAKTDQRHGLDVAYTLIQKIQDAEKRHQQGVAQTAEAVTAALLHDIGKLEAPFSIISRILYVVLKKIFRRLGWSKWVILGEKKRAPRFLRTMYVLEYHAQIGDYLLKQINTSSVVREMVRQHQKPLDLADSVALNLLKEADNDLEISHSQPSFSK